MFITDFESLVYQYVNDVKSVTDAIVFNVGKYANKDKGSADVKRPQDSVALAVRQHLNRHLHRLRVEDVLDAFGVVLALFGVVGELVEVFELHAVDEITAVAVVGEQPDLGELVALGHAVVQTHEVELVDRRRILLRALDQLVLLLVVETQSAGELIGGDRGHFDLNKVFLVLALICVKGKILRGMELS